ncbi:MAG: hypothetical protein GY853_15310 [PVC group bacterium]|nr:hypothetical protein [PVC group bacterium]
MTFYNQNRGYTIDADELDSNWKHIGQGSRLPMAGTAMTTTSGVYNLGSDIYRWKDVHVQNIDMSTDLNAVAITGDSASVVALSNNEGFEHCFNLIAEVTLTATASAIEITGLNGDTDEIYWVMIKLIKATSSGDWFSMYINNDDAANYGYQYLLGENATVTSARKITHTSIYVGGAGNSLGVCGFSESFIYAKTGNERLVLTRMLKSGGGTWVYQNWNFGSIWNNISDTITNLKFSVADIQPNTNIQIWTKR